MVSWRGKGIWVGLVVLAGACGDSQDGGTVSPGSMEEGGQGADAGGAGSDGNAGAQTGGSGTGGSTNGGAAMGGAGAMGGMDDATAGAETVGAGAGGDAPIGGAAGAGGDGARCEGTTGGPHWLSFNHHQGVFAYDVSRYPDSAGLIKLSAKATTQAFTAGPWSPDGRWLLYQDGADLVCRDMSQPEPGAALPIASAIAERANSAANVARLSWAADSSSVALATGTSLLTFDPSHEQPTLNAVTTSVRAAAWAPVGNRLFYGDDAGFHVVSVEAGQPGSSAPLDITSFKAWSPDGKLIAAVSDVDLVLIDVTGATPITVKLTNPTAAQPYVSSVQFSPNGKALAFTGAQARATPDLYYVPLDPVGEPEPITGPTGDAPGASSFAFWSPDGRWLGFNTTGLSSERRAVDVANGVLGVPFALKLQSPSPFSWLTKTPNTFVAWQSGSGASFATYDLSTPDADPIQVLLSALALFALSPVGDVLAANDVDAVAIRDLHAPPPPADVRVHLASSPNQLRWSPDGCFLSIIAEDVGYRPEVIHIAGSTPSKPLPVAESSPANITSSWQPVFR